jgi:site-specific DNA-methyltransferase (adenine-specific)
MADGMDRAAPGRIRDAILDVVRRAGAEAISAAEIEIEVVERIGIGASSSVRSYLNLNTPELFERTKRGFYRLKQAELPTVAKLAPPVFKFGKAKLYAGDCFDIMRALPLNSVHAIVTDPPYGLVEFSEKEVGKLRRGKGGIWRIPPSFDGAQRSPLPRFTVLGAAELALLQEFFFDFGCVALGLLAPGANVVVATNPLLSHHVAIALGRAGLEARGTLVRKVMTMRGGDRPKNAHEEFRDVSVMPRSMWEPWLLFRKPLEGRVQDSLRKWGTGGFRRPSDSKPFGDVIESSPTQPRERKLAPHPSLKPQKFLREVVRAALPLGEGTILDPFAGSGSTLAAANFCGLSSIGIEKDPAFVSVARAAIPALSTLDAVNPASSKPRDSSRVKRRSSGA